MRSSYYCDHTGKTAMKILFLHGWQSTPGGLKPTYLKDHGHEVLNPKLNADYDCADCGHTFPVNVSDDEMRSSLRTDHPGRCPACGQRVGAGHVTCRQCGTAFLVEMLHWHVHCNVASGTCPKCGGEYVTGCIC